MTGASRDCFEARSASEGDSAAWASVLSLELWFRGDGVCVPAFYTRTAMRATAVLLILVAFALFVSRSTGPGPYSIPQVQRAFAAEGIAVDQPDFSGRGQVINGAMLLAELWDATVPTGDLVVQIFAEPDAYRRVLGPLRDADAGEVLGRKNVVVIGPAPGADPRVEAALRRLP